MTKEERELLIWVAKTLYMIFALEATKLAPCETERKVLLEPISGRLEAILAAIERDQQP